MKKIVIAGMAAAAVLMSGAVPMAHATTSELTPQKQRYYGKKYLSIVCLANRVKDETEQAWKDGFGMNRVPFGTPVPQSVRAAYARRAKAESRAAMRMNQVNWPGDVAWDAEEIEKYYYSRAPRSLFVSKASVVNKRMSVYLKHGYDPGNAATRIRRALGLPPAGMGCK